MNNIDIDLYTIEELMTLNKQVVNRINFLQKQSQLETAAKFSIGDIVSFIDENDNKQEAMVTHINPKKNPSNHAGKARYLDYFSKAADFRT